MAENIPVHILLIWLKRGHDEVIEILYPHYAVIFYRYARKRGLTHEDAEDIVEEIFLHILKGIDTYDEVSGNGEGWIWSICKNLITSFLRRKRMENFLSDDLIDEDADPERCLEKNERFQTFTRTWQKISEADRRELRSGRGRGPGRKAWHEAVQRFRTLFYEEE